MQHYFGEIHGGLVELGEGDVHHLLHVKRAERNEEIEISTRDGGLFLCFVSSLDPLRIEVKGKIEGSRELDNEVYVGFALLKGDHNDLIIEKCTELGATAFFPFLSDRCIVKPDGKEDKRILRLRKIAEAASKQCRRNLVPEVKPYLTFGEMLEIEADVRLLPYEGLLGSSTSLWKKTQEIPKGKSILFLVGPEGGFTDSEVELAKKKGFSFVSLGRRMLRAETAAIYCASLLAGRSEN